jgi:FtsP/CotA-like multicopper oxidase with cupredoxin domain
VNKRYVMASMGMAGMVGILYVLYRHFLEVDIIAQESVTSRFKFQVYCPINKVQFPLKSEIQIVDHLTAAPDELRLLAAEMLAKPATNVDQYIIYEQMRPESPGSNFSRLYFCSFMTEWDNPNCSAAVSACTIPGAIFYVERRKPIEVAFVYDIHNEKGELSFRKAYTPCMSKTGYQIPYCKLMQKKKGFENCTYESPTTLEPSNTFEKLFQMSPSNIPIVTHVHGLEVRPSLDGNPLAWLGKGGEVGLAFQSLVFGGHYFNASLFKRNVSSSLLKLPGKSQVYAKVNRYENWQPPGDLWYHDHSMHITQDNVVHGLVGFYIIYDPVIDPQLPARPYHIFIVAGQHMTHSTVASQPGVNVDKEEIGAHMELELEENPSVPFFTQSGAIFMRNQTYSIRILNGNFNSVFSDLRFLTECIEVPGQPIDPATCRKQLTFTVIASDSALFKTPVHNVNRLTISSAERFQILIIFDGNIGPVLENPISSHANRVAIVVGPNLLKYEFILLPKSSTPNSYGKLPSQLMVLQGINFYDLTQVNQLCADVVVSNPTTCITMLRMKPIFNKKGARFFNGHYDFDKSGTTDNPKIGTTEDWVFISTGHRHPIHVHLINFQIISVAPLKNYTFLLNNT